MTPTPRWIPDRVEIPDSYGPYDAEVIEDETWNGALIPRFTREVADRIVTDSAALHAAIAAEYGTDAADDEVEVVRWSTDPAWPGVIELYRRIGATSAYIEYVPPDPDGRYAIGARAWGWEPALSDTDDARETP